VGAVGLTAALVLGVGATAPAFAGTPPSTPPASGGEGGAASAGNVPGFDPTKATTPEEVAGGTGSGSGVGSGDQPFETLPPEGGGGTPGDPTDAEQIPTTPDWPAPDAGPKSPAGEPTIEAHDDVLSVASGHSIRINWDDLVGNDVNPSGLAVPADHSWPAHGSRSVFSTLDTADRYITYWADEGFVGKDSFQYEVRDASGAVGIAPATVIIHVTPQSSPVVTNDVYTAKSYHSIEVSGGGLTMNDTDADGDKLTVKLLPAYGPQHGTVVLAPGSFGGFTYTPTPGYVGTDMFGYQAVDGYGGSSLLGVATITVLEEIHATGVLTISGTPSVGYWLSAKAPVFTPASTSIAYQWYRGASAIPGATQPNYSVHDADAGSALSVRILASKPGMQSMQFNSLATAPITRLFTSTSTPTVSGTAKVGSTLTAATPGWQPAPESFTYQWRRNGSPITGATASTLKLGIYDQGWAISVAVTAVKAGYQPVTTVSGSTGIVQAGLLTATPKPTISGTVKVGSKLTAVPGAWGPAPVSLAYVWKRSGVAISGATASGYTLTAADLGKAVTVTVTGTKAGFTTVAKTSSPTASVVVGTLTAAPKPTVAGTAKVGSKLTAVAGTWGPAPVALSYTWKRAGVAITGATASSYTLTAADLGKTVTVTVKGAKSGFTSLWKTSAPTATVVAGTLTATPQPTITGTAKVGSKLTAVAGTWGPAPVALSYTWKRSGVAITGATASSYTLTAADLGKTVTVTVKGAKSGFTSLWKTSVPTAKIAAK
jgi:hypothetical protein